MDTAQVREVLGLLADPTTGEVRVARRQFAKRAHPDLHGEGRARVMADVNEACDRLIARIRRGERRAPPRLQPPPGSPTAPVVQRSTGPVFRPLYALFTIAVTVLAAAATLLLGGVFDTTAVAVAVLVGGLAGLVFLLALARALNQR